MNSLAYKGKLVIIGVTSGIKAELNLALMVKRQQIIGSVLRSRPVPEKAEIIAEFTRVALPSLPTAPSCQSSRKFSRSSEWSKRTKMMEADKHFGKIVLRIQ